MKPHVHDQPKNHQNATTATIKIINSWQLRNKMLRKNIDFKLTLFFFATSRPERLYCVLVLGLQYSCVLGFPNTYSLFCNFSNTIQYYTIL